MGIIIIACIISIVYPSLLVYTLYMLLNPNTALYIHSGKQSKQHYCYFPRAF